MKHVLIIGNGAGSQAKTTLAWLLAEIYRAQFGRYPDALIDCDEEKSLARMLGDTVIGVPVSAKIEQLLEQPALITGLFDALGHAIVNAKECAIVDLGANIDAPVFDWARTSDFAVDLEECKVDILVPVVAEPKGISRGTAMLEAAADVFPSARRTLVKNMQRPWAAHERDFETMSALAHRTATMPACLSTILWPQLIARSITPGRAVELGWQEVGRVFDLEPFVARRELKMVSDWAKKMVKELEFVWE